MTKSFKLYLYYYYYYIIMRYMCLLEFYIPCSNVTCLWNIIIHSIIYEYFYGIIKLFVMKHITCDDSNPMKAGSDRMCKKRKKTNNKRLMPRDTWVNRPHIGVRWILRLCKYEIVHLWNFEIVQVLDCTVSESLKDLINTYTNKIFFASPSCRNSSIKCAWLGSMDDLHRSSITKLIFHGISTNLN